MGDSAVISGQADIFVLFLAQFDQFIIKLLGLFIQIIINTGVADKIPELSIIFFEAVKRPEDFPEIFP